jgi:hypothetical protein
MWSSAANIVNISAGGTEILEIDGTSIDSTVPFNVVSANDSSFTGGGNVGFGTTTPNESIESGAILINSSGSFSGSGFILDKSGNNGRLHAYHSSGDAELSFETTASGTNAERMRIDKDGNVGIGTTSPAEIFDVYLPDQNDTFLVSSNGTSGKLAEIVNIGSTADVGVLRMYKGADSTVGAQIAGDTGDNWFLGNVAIGHNSPSYKLDVNGDVRADTYYYDTTSTLQSSSDAQLKKNIADLPSQLDKINAVRAVTYELKKPRKIQLQGRHTGVIAQELELLYPELIGENADGYKTVGYQGLIIPMLKAIQELSAKVETLEAKVA